MPDCRRCGVTQPEARKPEKGTGGRKDLAHHEWHAPGRWQLPRKGRCLTPPDAGPGDAVFPPGRFTRPGPARSTLPYGTDW